MFKVQFGKAWPTKLASQQATKGLPEHDFYQHLLEKQAQGRRCEEEGGEAASLLLLRLHEWSHLLLVLLKRLLIGGGFVQGLSQQVGSGACHPPLSAQVVAEHRSNKAAASSEKKENDQQVIEAATIFFACLPSPLHHRDNSRDKTGTMPHDNGTRHLLHW